MIGTDPCIEHEYSQYLKDGMDAAVSGAPTTSEWGGDQGISVNACFAE